jgi:3-oxoacyl-[acyl-carrier-protein] synthase II
MLPSQVVISGYAQLSALGHQTDQLDLSLRQGLTKATTKALDLAGTDPFNLAVFEADLAGAPTTSPSKLPLDRGTALALQAARAAVIHAQCDLEALSNDRLGVYWGSGMGGAGSFDTGSAALYRDHKRIRPTSVVTTMPNAPAAELALLFKAQGASISFACACASSAVAIGEAMWALQSGRLDMAIVGGSESMLTPGVLASWQALRVLAPWNMDEDSTCRPFDLHRNGFVMGEGAGALVLETAAHARLRGHEANLVLSGYGTNCDASHITNPDSAGQVKAMQMALMQADLEPKDIGYVNAHGTATQAGDAAEATSLQKVFGEFGVPVSSTKGLHGHLLGAGGVIELIVALRALHNQFLPGNAHLQHNDPQLLIDVLPTQGRGAPYIRHAMSNSFAFGGTNAVLIASLLA